ENLVEQFLVDGCGHDSGDTFHGETYGAGYGIGFCMADELTLMVAVRKGFIDIEFNSSAGGNADEFFLFLFFDVADDDAGLFAAEVGSGVFQETLEEVAVLTGIGLCFRTVSVGHIFDGGVDVFIADLYSISF